jgi:hypothetical protein
MQTEHTCKKCKLTKSATAFNKNSKARDGLSTNCKSCANAISAEWARKQKEKKYMQYAKMN